MVEARRRSAFRFGFHVIMLVILGAIVNVAVAWACVCWGPTPSRLSAAAIERRWRAPVPDDWPPTAKHWRVSRLGLTEYDVAGDAPRNASQSWDRSCQWVAQSGLPFRGLFMYRNRIESLLADSGWPMQWERPERLSDGLVIPDWVPCPPFNRRMRFLPTQVLWPGFAMNTVFYAAILWLIFGGPFALRRRLRARRGQCQACGYPIGVSPVCTECGAALPASAVARLASRHE